MQMETGSQFVGFDIPKPKRQAWAPKGRDSVTQRNVDQVKGLSTDRPKIRTAYNSIVVGSKTTRDRFIATANASIFSNDSAGRPNTHRGQTTNYMGRR